MNNLMVCIVLFAGVYFSFNTKFVQVRNFKECLKQLFSKDKKKCENGISPFQAVTTALAGTIGTGNIVGVATAIYLGGIGSMFWMWVSSFFAMATKYKEIYYAIEYQQKDEKGLYGGPMYYLKKYKLSGIFCLCCVLCSFGTGNMVQANAVTDSFRGIIDGKLIAILLSIGVFLVIVGGIKRIAKITEVFIPFMALFYIIGCVIILIMNFSKIPLAFEKIIVEALDFKSAACGFMAMKIGCARGVFTNEAGLGSAPITHAAACAKSPHKQALLGVFEVFFDTIVMCTLTGLTIAVAGTKGLDGAALTLSAFQKNFGNMSVLFIAISTLFFAFSSIICWSYYGESAINYLFKKNKNIVIIFKVIFVIFIYVGGIINLQTVWKLADILNTIMMIPNILGLILLSLSKKNKKE